MYILDYWYVYSQIMYIIKVLMAYKLQQQKQVSTLATTRCDLISELEACHFLYIDYNYIYAS